MENFFNWYFASGDEQFFHKEQLDTLTFFPDLWKGQEGLGVSSLQYLWVDYPYRLFNYVLSRIGFSWFVINKLWWLMVFYLCIFSSYKLSSILNLDRKYRWIASLIYSTNTYILMVFDGGQLGVALAYSLAPYTIYKFYIYILNKGQRFSDSIFLAVVISVQFFLDLRIAYITFFIIILLSIFIFLKQKFQISKHTVLIPLIIILLNCFWLLPTLLYKNSLQSFISGTETNFSGLKFFSVATFTDSLSLLHPNYPDNLFGYIYHFKPEFLLIFLLSFTVLLIKKTSKLVHLLTFMALVGAFLAKGVNPPLGNLYVYFNQFLPGFFLFRDPTKWYLMVSISYSLLIPLSLFHISKKLNTKNTVIIVFIVFWMFSLRFVFNGRVSGNLTPIVMTKDYQQLKNLLAGNQNPGRTVWIPKLERLEYSSELHPAISATSLYTESSAAGILFQLSEKEGLLKIASYGGKYIVVPEDVEQRIFLDNYRFDEKIRNNLVAFLDQQTNLKKVDGFDKIAVYENLDTFSFFKTNEEIVWGDPEIFDKWSLLLPQRTKSTSLKTLISYDPNWRLKTTNININPENDNGLMKFSILPGKEEIISLEYLPTGIAKIGAIISIAIGIICIFILFL